MDEPFSLNAKRRAIILAIGGLGIPFGTVSLVSCGGGNGTESTADPTPPAVKAKDTEIVFSADPVGRLLFLSNAAGYALRYYGTNDSAGKPATVDSVVFESPSGIDGGFICELGDALTITLANSDTMSVASTPDGDFRITMFAATNGNNYSTTLSALRTTAGAKAAAALLTPTILRASANRRASILDLANLTQDIQVFVRDSCKNLTSGSLWAKIAPNSDLAQQSLLGKLLFPPAIDLKLSYNPGTKAFEGSVPLTAIQSKLQVMTSDAAAVEEGIIKSLFGALKVGKALAEALVLLPAVISQENTSVSDIFSLLLKKMGSVWAIINDMKSAVSNGIKLFDNITDIYQVLATADSATNRFPILVTATWKTASTTLSGSTVVDYPGQTVASISLGDTVAFAPTAPAITISPAQPPAGEIYTVSVEIPNACQAPSSYILKWSIVGSDGYTPTTEDVQLSASLDEVFINRILAGPQNVTDQVEYGIFDANNNFAKLAERVVYVTYGPGIAVTRPCFPGALGCH